MPAPCRPAHHFSCPLSPSQTLFRSPVVSHTEMSESLLLSTFMLLCKHKPVCSLSQEHLQLCITLQYLPKDCVILVLNERNLSPKQTSQEKFRQARFFLGFLELHRAVFPTCKSLTVNVAHPCATSIIFHLILFSNSILTNLKIFFKRK